MHRRAHWVLLLVAEAACMACGLAFHLVYVTASLNQAAETQAWDALAPAAKHLSLSLNKQQVMTHGSGANDLEQQLAILRTAATETSGAVAVVDNQGRLILDASGRPAEPGIEPIHWARSSSPWGTGDQPIRGVLDRPTGPSVAVAYPLASQEGYVLIERSEKRTNLELASIQPVLYIASGIALVWTLGLLCATLFLLLSYFRGEREKKKTSRPDVEALKQTQALVRTQETVIFGLAKLSDSRDPETGNHLERIAYYSSTLASAMRQHPAFRNIVTPSFVRLIGISSALHDIGKVGVEDAILRKPGPLTQQERSRMQEHTRVGEDCLREIERRLGTSNFLQMAREITSSHHERWDGSGYPQGLIGEQIPLAARIVAIADVYDALASRRVYKAALPHEQCVAIIAEQAGKHFDPRLVEIFLQIEASFRHMARQFGAASRDPVPTQDPPSAEAPELVHAEPALVGAGASE